jgi:hypothetical protein
MRGYQSDAEAARAYAAELLALTPDIILVSGTQGSIAVKQLTRTVPIVFVNVADPVGSGIVDSLARPGGNITGFMVFDYSFGGKLLDLLKQIAPHITRVAVFRDENGLAVFDLIRRHGALASAVFCAFDLLELDGRDLRREPIENRKELLAKLLRGSHLSLVLNAHFEEDGALVYGAACQLGCEGIVSKRLGSSYRSGRSPHWVKVKNPKAPALSARPRRIGAVKMGAACEES